jgi:hypothetical protein
MMASWCPVHGDCTCPRSDDGEIAWHYEPGIVSFHGFPAYSATAGIVTHYDPECPIHSLNSAHAA